MRGGFAQDLMSETLPTYNQGFDWLATGGAADCCRGVLLLGFEFFVDDKLLASFLRQARARVGK